jgi:hypothetical protein
MVSPTKRRAANRRLLPRAFPVAEFPDHVAKRIVLLSP